MKSVAVIIPVYKVDLNPHELVSFQQCVKTLGTHPIILIKPESLDVSQLLTAYPVCQVESFDDIYFQAVSGYNRLLLSASFYERFLGYEYILIAQLDTFIFRDELLDWCRRGYDYIGAPQFDNIRPKRTQRKTLREWTSRLYQQPLQNGGLSLRRVRACLRLLNVYHRFFGQWPGNEDGFFSLHFPRLLPFRPLMKLPLPIEALQFAIEMEPRESVKINGGQLPMGCHAWDVYDLDFWRPIINGYSYVV